MIVISTAHSRVNKGAANENKGINEYGISRDASFSCFDVLRNNGIACTLIDCGDLTDIQYSKYKTELINSMVPKPDLALEIHLNSFTDNKPFYGEVLYQIHNSSAVSKLAAEMIADSINKGVVGSSNYMEYKSKGAQKPEKRDFFLYNIHCPSVIVEGFFISNDNQAEWLRSGGSHAYGVLVANGIIDLLKRV